VVALDIIPAGFLHAARAAAEEETNFVIGTVALVNPYFLPLPFGKEDEFRRHGQAGGLLEQRPDTAAERTAGDVGTAEGILNDGVIGAADFERALACADV
jgi:hypothetical protein